MLQSLFSGSGPGSKLMIALALIVFLGLALTPFLFSGTRAMETRAKVAIFIVRVAS